jgi:ABC-type phosphate transport system substrate-binding protein
MLGIGKKKSARAGLRAALLAGATVAALGLGGLGATGASAALNCTGSNITGQGASLQKVAQQNVWNPGFNAVGVCPGGPTITYNSTGSGGGLKEWNHDGLKGNINTKLAWISTDDPPSAAQIANVESVAGGAKLAVFPITQTAIAIAANLPAGCSFAEETGITNIELQRVFRGNLKTWSALSTTEGTCNSPITRVVRKDSSGTTYQFKNYLARMNSSALDCVGGQTWLQLREINGPEPTPNQTWPEDCGSINLTDLVKPASNGNGPVVNKVDEIDGSIAYSGIADIHANADLGTIVVPLQNNGKVSAFEATFAAPETGTVANCSNTPYYIPAGARPGAVGTDVDWTSTFGAYPNIGSTDYPLCTLTFAMAFNGYNKVPDPDGAGEEFGPFTEAQFITVNDYLREYVTATKGQEDIATQYFAPLPTSGQPWHDARGSAHYIAGKMSW